MWFNQILESKTIAYPECQFHQLVQLVQLVQRVQLDLWVQVVQTDHCCLQGQEGQVVQEILQDLRNPVDPGHLMKNSYGPI